MLCKCGHEKSAHVRIGLRPEDCDQCLRLFIVSYGKQTKLGVNFEKAILENPYRGWEHQFVQAYEDVPEGLI